MDQFSKLAYAGKLAEVSQEDLVKASKAWSVEAAKGKSITGDFIGDLIAMADAFANTADGAGKVAFAVDKFGRSGQAMIPLLNQGSAALREQFDEAQKFGQVIGGDFARNADTFNDNLDRMKSLFTGIWLQVADRILPVLVAYSEALIDLAKNSDLVQNTVSVLATVMVEIAKGAMLATEAWITFSTIVTGGSLTDAGNDLLNLEEKIQEVLDALQTLRDNPAAAKEPFRDELAGVELFQKKVQELAQEKNRLEDESLFRNVEARIKHNEEMALLDANEILNAEQKALLKFQIDQNYYLKLRQLEQQDRKARLAMHVQYATGTATIMGNLATVAQAFGKKGFAAFKAFRIAEALASTYAGAARALADYAWPFSIIVAASVVAAGIANVAQIAASKPSGQAHGGLDYVPSESTFLLSRGERVIQPAANQDLTRYLRDQDAGGRGVQINIMLDGSLFGQAIGRLSRDGRLQLDARSIT